MSNIVEVSEETYEQEVLKTDIPVLIDFSAEWCGTCKMLAPIFDSLSNKYNGNVKFIKLDIDSNRTISSKLGIMGVPTIILFKNGKELERIVGLQPEENFQHLQSFRTFRHKQRERSYRQQFYQSIVCKYQNLLFGMLLSQ